MASEATIATIVLVVVTASLPCYLYGAWIILREETVTWGILTRHLTFIAIGLVLTTVPALVWMLPRSLVRVDGFIALHAFLGVQAYALLAFALTGIVRIFRAKHAHDLYREPDPTVALDDLGERMDTWRFRLRVGVFGYLLLWLVAWVVGFARYLLVYVA